MLRLLLVFVLLCPVLAMAQRRDSVVLVRDGGNLYGTLTIPEAKGPVPLVVIIAGTGPTDRDGNQQMQKNSSLRYLADSLAKYGISTLRFDKRGIGASKSLAPDEKHIRFDDYIGDAAGWVRKYRTDKRFNRIFIAGHSEGALIGTLAAQKEPVAGLISVSGVAFAADSLIVRQIAASRKDAPVMADSLRFLFARLRKDGHVDDVPGGFYQMLLRPAVQAYIYSWMKYSPTIELSRLKVPILVLQGTSDMQIDTLNGQILAASNPRAHLRVIQGMNHVLKDSPMDPMENQERYIMPDYPLNTELVQEIVAFVRRSKR